MAVEREKVQQSLKMFIATADKYYGSIGFVKTDEVIRKAMKSVELRGHVGPNFMPDYARALKADCDRMVDPMKLTATGSRMFKDSFAMSIDAVREFLDENCTESPVLFENFQSSVEAQKALTEFMTSHDSELMSLVQVTDAEKSIAFAKEFYKMVHENVVKPAEEYVLKQVGSAGNAEKKAALLRRIFSVRGSFVGHEEVSDISLAFDNDGTFSQNKEEYTVLGKFTLRVSDLAVCPLLMYYKVPIITAMLPMFNIQSLSKIDMAICKQ